MQPNCKKATTSIPAMVGAVESERVRHSRSCLARKGPMRHDRGTSRLISDLTVYNVFRRMLANRYAEIFWGGPVLFGRAHWGDSPWN